MDIQLIQQLFGRFEAITLTIAGVECWSARELQTLLGYSEWRNFLNVIEKAKIACANSNGVITDHFVEFNKMVSLGSGSEREIDDYALTRYACYLIAQNGDPAKPAIAFAMSYFAVQTRQQEIIQERLTEIDRIKAREKLSETENLLSGIIYQRGVDNYGFANIRSKGDQALFGGFSTQMMKVRLNTPDNRPLADFLPTVTIKAKDLATEMTNVNVVEKNLRGESNITQEHVQNNLAVRRALGERNIKPENLPAAEDLQKVKRKLNSDEKKVLKPSKGVSRKPPKK
jgi:DNA-damage-inducible protein D